MTPERARLAVCYAGQASMTHGAVVQWQNFCFPSRQRGFDSRQPLHFTAPSLGGIGHPCRDPPLLRIPREQINVPCAQRIGRCAARQLRRQYRRPHRSRQCADVAPSPRLSHGERPQDDHPTSFCLANRQGSTGQPAQKILRQVTGPVTVRRRLEVDDRLLDRGRFPRAHTRDEGFQRVMEPAIRIPPFVGRREGEALGACPQVSVDGHHRTLQPGGGGRRRELPSHDQRVKGPASSASVLPHW